MRPRARIEHEGVGRVRGPVELFDELALVVALKEDHLEAQIVREVLDALLEPGQREIAVVLGGPAAQRVEVDPVHDRDAVSHPASSFNAARTASSSTAWPLRTSPGPPTRTKPTRPPRRFLSRPTALSTASRSTAASRRVGSPRASSSCSTSARSAGRSESVSAARSPSPTASPWR